jgi:DNA ligase-1
MSSSILNTKTLLDVVAQFVEDMNSSNSGLHKAETFKTFYDTHPDRNGPFLKTLVYVNDGLMPFNVTKSNVLKFKKDKKKQAKKIKASTYTDGKTSGLALFKLLNDLHTCEISGDKAKQTIVDFMAQYPEHEDLILNIIDKDLKIRYTSKSINKVAPGLIPLFQVSLGEKYDKSTKKYLEKKYNNGWYISRKLDGVRCICRISKSVSNEIEYKKTNQTAIDSFFQSKPRSTAKRPVYDVKFYSRQGKQFQTLSKLEDDVRNNLLKIVTLDIPEESKGIVLDGEVCSMDSKGNEDFQGIMKEINKKGHTMVNPKYLLFDMLTIEEFESGTSKRLLSSRLAEVNKAVDKSDCTRLSCIQQLSFTDDAFVKMQQQVADYGWEGLILRKNDKYIGDRSKDILKVKKFHREEYVVQGIETCKMRVINDTTGLEEEIETLKAAIIDHKGYEVCVGSGFSLDERRQFFESPKELIGKVISVQFFEETKDKNGELSLRFPTFKGLYGDSREF